MKSYLAFVISAPLALIGLCATILVQGGWEAVAAAFTGATGLVCLFSVIALGAARDRVMT